MNQTLFDTSSHSRIVNTDYTSYSNTASLQTVFTRSVTLNQPFSILHGKAAFIATTGTTPPNLTLTLNFGSSSVNLLNTRPMTASLTNNIFLVDFDIYISDGNSQYIAITSMPNEITTGAVSPSFFYLNPTETFDTDVTVSFTLQFSSTDVSTSILPLYFELK